MNENILFSYGAFYVVLSLVIALSREMVKSERMWSTMGRVAGLVSIVGLFLFVAGMVLVEIK